MRLPDARVCAMASSIVFTASSASFGASWLWRALSSSMSCDFVMARFSPPLSGILCPLFLVLRPAKLRLEQRPEIGGAGARGEDDAGCHGADSRVRQPHRNPRLRQLRA